MRRGESTLPHQSRKNQEMNETGTNRRKARRTEPELLQADKEEEEATNG